MRESTYPWEIGLMKRSVMLIAVSLFLMSGVSVEAGGRKKSKVKPLPDRYKQFKLGMPRKLIERKITPAYTHEPAPNIKIMVFNVGSNEVQGMFFVFWKEKLASILLIFQQSYTLERVKANLVKKHGEPTKEDPMETLWIDSERVMGLKFEYNVMDLRNRVTLAYTDIEAYQEIKAAGVEGPRAPWKKGGKGRVPPK